MYPNPQEALPLPPHPDVEHYRKRAKELVGANRSGEDALLAWTTQWIRKLLELQTGIPEAARRDVERLAPRITAFARQRLTGAKGELSQAQFVLARAHGFASWSNLVRHIEELSSTASDISTFERADDAIVGGDIAVLDRLLSGDLGLVRARSTRDHGATLLHYVSANGVENYRQKTPANIHAIATRLLDAGADVNAEADVYGGGATTLGLVVTSAHPRRVGVQNALADLLLERGGKMGTGIVRDCLMNGCPEAAAHTVARGAPVNLEEAAGIGRLDIIMQYFEPPHTVSPADAAAALIMGSWYDQRDVVTFLLDRGVDAGIRTHGDGTTALHIAAYLGNTELVTLLLERGAPNNVTDAVHGTPPLVWALHAWLVERRGDSDAYRAVLNRLVESGAPVKPEWLDDERLRAEKDLHALLSRRASTP